MSAVAQLALDVRGFLAGCDLAKQGIDSVRKSAVMTDGDSGFVRIQAAAIGAVAAVSALAVGMYKGTMSAIQLGSKMTEVAYDVGITAGETLKLQSALVDFGGKADEAVPSVKTFNAATKDMASLAPELGRVLTAAGVGFEKLAPMGVLDRMRAVSAAIDEVRNPIERARAAAQAFGSAGMAMVEALRPGNLNSAGTAIGAQAELLERNAGVFARVSQLLGVQGSSLASLANYAQQKLQGLFVGIASEVAPQILAVLEASRSGGASLADSIRSFSPALKPLADLVDRLVRLDFSGMGAQIGGGVASIVQAVRSGDALRYLQLGFEVISVEFDRQISGTISGLQSAFAAATAGLNFGGIVKGLGTALEGAGSLFVSVITSGVAKIILALREAFPTLFNLAGIDAINALLNKSAQAKREGSQSLAQGIEQVTGSTKANTEAIKRNFSEIIPAFKAGRETGMAGDTTAQRAEMGEIENRAAQRAADLAARARALFATPAPVVPELTAPAATVETRTRGALGFDFASSLTKIGGNMFGPSLGGDTLQLQRQQLALQQRQADQQNVTNMLLQAIKEKSGANVYQ